MRQFEEESLLQQIEQTQITIRAFLAGPAIKVEGPEPSNGPAAVARYRLFHKLNKLENLRCSLGEHKELISIYKTQFDELSNLSVAEFNHVRDHTDCSIILPSSPGSFCELGMFSMSDTICQSMLILYDEGHQDPPGYALLGPISFALDYGAKMSMVNYEDEEGVWAVVSDFLSTIERKKRISSMRLR